MTRIARLTDALRGRKAVAIVGAAAALASVGAGTAMAATAPGHAAPAHLASPAAHAAALTGHAAPATLNTRSATGRASTQASSAPAVHTAAPQAQPTSQASQAAQAAQVAQRDQQAAGGQLNQGGNYQIYDSTTPSQIPAGENNVATYADGPFQVSHTQVTGKQVLWIDTNGSDPDRAAVLDVEPGDATPTQAAQWVQQRETAHPGQLAVVYTMRSDWGATQQAISALPHAMQDNVRWWIADPTGTPHILPGATATQWYWGSGYDISSANGTL